MLYIKYFLIVVSLSLSNTVSAVQLTLSELQINSMVATQFPQQHVKDGLTVTLDKPVVSLFAKKQMLLVKIALIISDGENAVVADLSANSPVVYSRSTMSFELLKPEITEFYVRENSLLSDQVAVNNMQTWLFQQIPSVITLQRRMFNVGFIDAAPAKIIVLDQGVLMTY